METHDKQIMAGLLLDKDKAAVPEAINIVSNTVKEIAELTKDKHDLLVMLVAILKCVPNNEVKIPKWIVDSVSPIDAIKIDKDERTGNIKLSLGNPSKLI